ncbi:hypothetical protein X975_15658, partial [Stegodyphus mimosarum]
MEHYKKFNTKHFNPPTGKAAHMCLKILALQPPRQHIYASRYFGLHNGKAAYEIKTNILLTSDQTRRPAEFKHINKRRKRNQQGFP